MGWRNEFVIPICCDSDLIGYGNQKVVIVDTYFKENARVFDMSVEVTDDGRKNTPYIHTSRSMESKLFIRGRL